MKRIICLLVVTLCLLLCISFTAPSMAKADNKQEGNKLALDMVILVDISDSMKDRNGGGNDVNYYSYEAAAMIIGMCDYENSRIALVPFGTDVYTYVNGSSYPVKSVGKYSDRLYGLSELSSFNTWNGPYSGSVRSCITSLLVDTNNSARQDVYGGQTALGAALKYGVNLLKPTASDKGNQKVVVLLTDGKIDLQADGGKSRQQLEREDTKKFTDAYQQAQKYGIKIYTVALKEKDVSLLMDASKATGAPATKIVENAEDLPDVFNSFFADMVDSEAIPVKTVDKDYGFDATIGVPNLSIAEINILVPVSRPGTVELQNPSGKTITPAFIYQSGNFTFIKIAKPNQTGEWKLICRTQTKPSAEMKVLFSYTVVPRIELTNNIGDRGFTFEKTQTVSFDVFLRELNGQNSRDKTLYSEECGIVAKLYLYDADGNYLVGNEPVTLKRNGTETKFTSGDIELSNFFKGTGDEIKQGEYTLVATLVGAGMNTEARQRITVLNLDPHTVPTKVEDNPFADLVIHDPTTISSEYQREFGAGVSIDLSKFVEEPDGERLQYTLKNTTGDKNVVINQSVKDGKLTMQTNNKTGEAVVHIEAEDTDGGKCVIDVPVKVTNRKSEIEKNYRVTINQSVDWDSRKIVYTASLYSNTAANDAVTQRKDKAIYDIYELTAYLTEDYEFTGHADKQNVQLVFKPTGDGETWTCEHKMSNHACTYRIDNVSSKIKDIEITTDYSACSFNHPNTAPTKTDVKLQDKYKTRLVIKDPFAEKYISSDGDTIALDDFMEDEDGQKLSFKLAENQKFEFITIRNANSNGSLRNNQLIYETTGATGSETVRIVAMDEDGAEVSFDISLSVTSVAQTINETYKLVIIVDPEPEETQTEYSISARLMQLSGEDYVQVTDPAVLKRVVIQAVRTATSYADKEIQFALDGNVFKATDITEANKAVYRVDAKLVTLTDISDGSGSKTLSDIAISADGAGFGIGNHPPRKTANPVNPFEAVEIHDPLAGRNDYTKEYTAEIDLNTWMEDEDKGQTLRFDWESGEPESDIFQVVSFNKAAGKLTLTTSSKSGTYDIKLTADDSNGGVTPFTIPVKVTNLRDVYSRYTIRVTGPQGTDPDGVNKSGTYRYSAKLYNGDGTLVTDENILAKVSITASQTVKYADVLNKADVTNSLQPSRNKESWTAEAATKNNECTYSVTASAYLGYDDIVLKVELPKSFTLTNRAPMSSGTAPAKVSLTVWDPLDENCGDVETKIDLSQYVVDADGEDLTYAVTIGGEAPNVVAPGYACDRNKGLLSFKTNHLSGNAEIIVTVKDDEGRGGADSSYTFSIPVEVFDVTNYVTENYSIAFLPTDSEAAKGGVYTYRLELRKGNSPITSDVEKYNRLLNIDPNNTYIKYVNRVTGEEKTLYFIKDSFDAGTMTIRLQAEPISGSYTVEGSPAIRFSSIAVVDEAKLIVNNHAPAATKAKLEKISLRIWDPLDKSCEEDVEKTVELNKYVKDADDVDKDRLRYEIEIVGDEIINSRSYQVKDGVLTFETNHLSGSAEIRVTVSDVEYELGDKTSCCVITVPVEVFDVTNYISDNFVLRFAPIADEIDKDSRYTYKLTLEDTADGKDIDINALSELIEFSPRNIWVKYVNSATGEEATIRLEDYNAEEMTAGFATRSTAGSYTVEGEATMKGSLVKAVDEAGMKVVNEAPVLAESGISALPESAKIAPWLWVKTNDETTEIDISKLFSDVGNDTLIYHAAQLPANDTNSDEYWLNLVKGASVTAAATEAESNTGSEAEGSAETGDNAETEGEETVETEIGEAQNAAPLVQVDEARLEAAGLSMLKLEDNGSGTKSKLSITNDVKGKKRFLFWATDTDGESVAMIHKLDVVNQKERMMFIGAIAIAAIILLIIIVLLVYWFIIRKPWKRAEHGQAAMYVNNVPKGTVTFPSRGKSDRTLESLNISSAVVEPGMAGSLRKFARGYKLRAGSHGTIIVMPPKKTEANFSVTVNGAPLRKGKKRNWNRGGTLTATYQATSGAITIEYRR